MKTLYLLRHAKAENRSIGTHGPLSDKDRPLSPRGHEDCARIGAYMVERGHAPDLILASSAARTAETAERIAPLLRPGVNVETHDDLYLSGAAAILRHIHALDDTFASAMFIGHNPGLHELACALVSQDPPTELLLNLKSRFPTCALAALTFDGPSWALCNTGEGTLVDFTYPKAL